MSKSELANEHALPADNYDYISRVEVPEGTDIRVATVGPQPEDGYTGGGTGIVIRQWNKETNPGWYEDPEPLDLYFN